ncbi:MAG: YicC family protein [Spirochaetales bacterium]|nr:MAG: YicC family protein [Spirochaetales bacterium]
MNSMTGFGHAEGEGAGISFSVELKSLNTRYLDIIISIPSALSVLEDRIRTLLQQQFLRGRVECLIRMKHLEDKLLVTVDENAARAWKEALDRLASLFPGSAEAGLDLLVHQEGVLKTEYQQDIEEYWQVLEPLLLNASEQVQKRRRQEGAALTADIDSQLSAMETALSRVAGKAPLLREEVEANLRRRFIEILGSDADEQKILSETALWIARNDINEEIVRLGTHIKTFRDDSQKPGLKGKKLDFLAQEMGREINTIGSKSPQADVSRLVVEMKDALEKIREQLRNVE